MSVVVVSWILVLMAIFGINYSHDMIGEAKTVALEVERHQLRAWAWSGVELARVAVEMTPGIDCAVLGHADADNILALPLACGQGNFGIGVASRTNGQESWIPGLQDESSRLPMALADSTSLASLPGVTPYGAVVLLEAKAAAGANRLPPFETLPNLDPSTLEAAKRSLSRYGDKVNLNTASAEVLEAVGLPRRAVGKLLQWRVGPDTIPGTADDRLFRTLGVDDEGIRSSALNSDEAAALLFLVESYRLSVDSRFFHLASRGWGPGHEGICEISVVLEKQEYGIPRIVEWNEQWLN